MDANAERLQQLLGVDRWSRVIVAVPDHQRFLLEQFLDLVGHRGRSSAGHVHETGETTNEEIDEEIEHGSLKKIASFAEHVYVESKGHSRRFNLSQSKSIAKTVLRKHVDLYNTLTSLYDVQATLFYVQYLCSARYSIRRFSCICCPNQ